MIIFKIAGTALVVLLVSFLLPVASLLKCKIRYEQPSESKACIFFSFVYVISFVTMIITAAAGFLMAIWG